MDKKLLDRHFYIFMEDNMNTEAVLYSEPMRIIVLAMCIAVPILSKYI